MRAPHVPSGGTSDWQVAKVRMNCSREDPAYAQRVTSLTRAFRGWHTQFQAILDALYYGIFAPTTAIIDFVGQKKKKKKKKLSASGQFVTFVVKSW